MKARWMLMGAVTLAVVGGVAVAATQVYAPHHPRKSWSTIQHGRYLTRVGDCKSCHTARGGKPFAGGRAVPTPFGIVYSSNITPDPGTGIGSWSQRDFYRAMHLGVDRKNNHLYPAFPYPSFTHMTRGDVNAIKAYLDTIQPVRQVDRSPKLSWPYSMRSMLGIWDKLYLKAGRFQPDPKHSALWNRGAYLVKGPAHCGACHTPRNFLGAPKRDQRMQGGYAEHVFAPNLGTGKRDGLSRWSKHDLVEYLATGSNARATAAGPMAEVVHNSTQYLHKRDLKAIATYIKSLDGPDESTPKAPDKKKMRAGRELYVDNCSGCHMSNGKGLPDAYPKLAGSSAIQAKSPKLLIAVILEGAQSPKTYRKPTGLTMPAFGSKLDDAEIARVTTYIRNAWGNRASHVSRGKVADMRQTLATSP